MGQDGEGQQKGREGDVIGHHPALDPVGQHQGHGHQQLAHGQVDHPPDAGPTEGPKSRVRRIPAGPQPDAGPAQGQEGDGGHGHHAGGGAQRQHQPVRQGQVEAAVTAGEDDEGHHGGDHHHVVGHRGEGGGREPPGAVQHGRGHRADCVEQDLGHEHPQQEAAEAHLGVAHGVVGDSDGEGPHDPRPGHQPDDGDRAEHGEGHAQHRPGQALGVLAPAGVEQGDERGHQHRGQDPGGQKLEEQVGDQVGGLVRVAQVGGAQGPTHGHHPEQPGHTGGDVADGDLRARPWDGDRPHGVGAGRMRWAPGPTP